MMVHEGVMALTVAILSPQFLTPEQSFRKLWGEAKRPRTCPSETLDMIRMKETMTYQQIGDLFGLNADAVYNRIRRARGRL